MTVQLHPHRRRFQSTLPREERPSLYLLGAHLHNFNPRSHERSDSQQSELITMLRISIHAPTRGATAWKVTRRQSKKFQSTLPREERREAVAMLASNIVFQSTLPREERPRKRWKTPGTKLFQSTLPREERQAEKHDRLFLS